MWVLFTTVSTWRFHFPQRMKYRVIKNRVRENLTAFCISANPRQVETFFKGRDKGSGARAADQAIERIKSNIEWVERSAKTIAEFLNKI